MRVADPRRQEIDRLVERKPIERHEGRVEVPAGVRAIDVLEEAADLARRRREEVRGDRVERDANPVASRSIAGAGARARRTPARGRPPTRAGPPDLRCARAPAGSRGRPRRRPPPRGRAATPAGSCPQDLRASPPPRSQGRALRPAIGAAADRRPRSPSCRRPTARRQRQKRRWRRTPPGRPRRRPPPMARGHTTRARSGRSRTRSSRGSMTAPAQYPAATAGRSGSTAAVIRPRSWSMPTTAGRENWCAATDSSTTATV